MTFRSFGPFIAGLLVFMACDSDHSPITPGETGTAPVAIRFTTTSPTSLASTALSAVIGPGTPSGDSLVLSDSSDNVLVINDIRLIVAEFELEGMDDKADSLRGQNKFRMFGKLFRVKNHRDFVEFWDNDSSDFKLNPAFIALPLGPEDEVEVTTDDIPLGTYTRLKFKVEDLQMDEDDEDSLAIQELQDAILAEFPDWPEEASMVILGSYTPAGGAAKSFKVYFDVELKVRQKLEEPLVISEEGASTEAITVQLNPEEWFRRKFSGRVIDLSLFDYDTTGEVVELRPAFANGVKCWGRRK